MKRIVAAALVALCAVAACGGASSSQPTAAIPAQPAIDASAIDAGAQDAAREASPSAERSPPPPLPAGANGPRDARAMIGEAGDLAPTPHRATLLVNTSAVRAHPWSESLGRAITGVFSGWDTFMPYDVVHPFKDIDWVMMSGSLVMGSTEQNVFVARYNLDETKADAASGALMKRLPSATKTDLGVKGLAAFTTRLDGAERLYVRPKPGVLAIVPTSEGKRAVALLRKADVPQSVRPGELVRVAYDVGPKVSFLFRSLPRSITSMRAWLEATADGGVVAHAEADTPTASDAEFTARQLEDRLAQALSNGMGRVAFGGLVERTRIWPDGTTVRVRAELAEQEINALAAFACLQSPRCTP